VKKYKEPLCSTYPLSIDLQQEQKNIGLIIILLYKGKKG
jgi:hypothetical protein